MCLVITVFDTPGKALHEAPLRSHLRTSFSQLFRLELLTLNLEPVFSPNSALFVAPAFEGIDQALR